MTVQPYEGTLLFCFYEVFSEKLPSPTFSHKSDSQIRLDFQTNLVKTNLEDYTNLFVDLLEEAGEQEFPGNALLKPEKRCAEVVPHAMVELEHMTPTCLPVPSR